MDNYNPNNNEIICGNSFYENFHFLLGKIIVNYNLIESKLIMFICNLVDISDITIGFIICKRKSATQLLELFSDLVNKKIKDKEILNKFNDLYCELKKIIELRNTFIHSIYLDTTNSEIKLSNKIKEVQRIRLREFEKGETTINSIIIKELTSLQGLLQWLNHMDEETDKFSHLLSKEIPMKKIAFQIPDESKF